MRRPEKIWILEDDEGTIFVLDEILGIHYHLEFFRTIKELSNRLAEKVPRPQLIIADLKLKDGYFTDFLSSQEKLNANFDFPFLIISSIDDPSALRFCFKKGALDYLVKPFKKNELAVKVERLLDQFSQAKGPLDSQTIIEQTPISNSGPISQTTRIKLEQLQASLTMKESQIIQAFLDSEKNAVTKNELFIKAWGETTVSSKSLDVHLSHLRGKLKHLNIKIVSIGDGVWEFQQIG